MKDIWKFPTVQNIILILSEKSLTSDSLLFEKTRSIRQPKTESIPEVDPMTPGPVVSTRELLTIEAALCATLC